MSKRDALLFLGMFGLIALVGFLQSWNVALTIFNMGIISAILSLGVNIQWGYAGLFNIGIAGFIALGGLMPVLVSMPPVREAWNAGGIQVMAALAVGLLSVILSVAVWNLLSASRKRVFALVAIAIIGFALYRFLFDPGVLAIEKVNSASTGYLGGLGLPVLLAWPAGAVLAGAAAFVIGKITLGLRTDYLAIATLGIAEIIVSTMKNEDWLTRGVKNVAGLPRPVPYEVDLQNSAKFGNIVDSLGIGITEASSILVKLCYSGLFLIVLGILLWLSQRALSSPWGRMMRAIRDNESTSRAMGKNVNKRRLQVFVLGSAVCGLAGAMMVTLDGQYTPAAYQPLRFTFLIWVMVIVGGSGNNLGAVLGGFLVWFFWIEVEPLGRFILEVATSGLNEDNPIRMHLIESSGHMRLLTMGVILLLIMRFNPGGLIPERTFRIT